MDPETLKQIEALMAGNNPDAGADYEEICQVVEQKLVPTFEMLGKMLKSIDDKASQALAMTQKIVGAMSDAVMGQKHGEFEDLLNSKFGADIGPLDSFYSDTMGTKFSDQLIDELMSSDVDNPEEFISSKIGETKGKYGKYLGMPAPESAAEEAAEPPEEQTPEEEAGEIHEEPAEVAVEVKSTKKKKPTAEDMAGLLGLKMSKV